MVRCHPERPYRHPERSEGSPMDLNFSPEDQKFRAEVRAFIDANLPHDTRDKVLNGKRLKKDDFMRWHKILHKKGWVAHTWPKQFGGPGWSVAQQNIFEEECADAGAPPL